MSATLGETALAALEGRQRRSFVEAAGMPYPAIRAGGRTVPVEATGSRSTTARIVTTEAALAAAAAATRQEACRLVIRSTVADAVAMRRALAGMDIETMLHHSRYALHDRTMLDRRLMAIMGPAGRRRGVIVVATQADKRNERSPPHPADALPIDRPISA